MAGDEGNSILQIVGHEVVHGIFTEIHLHNGPSLPKFCSFKGILMAITDKTFRWGLSPDWGGRASKKGANIYSATFFINQSEGEIKSRGIYIRRALEGESAIIKLQQMGHWYMIADPSVGSDLYCSSDNISLNRKVTFEMMNVSGPMTWHRRRWGHF